MTATLSIGPLHGGGLVLGYRCPSRCRHCLYACGPHRRDGLGDGPGALDRVLDALAARAPHAAYHVGGGEPFLDLDLLERAVAGFRARGLRLDYVETNASWVRDRDHAVAVLSRLARAGLRCVLVSLSPFHAEFVPWGRATTLIEAAGETLPGGAFPWLAEFARDLAAEPDDARLDLDAFLAARGDRYARDLAARYALVPSGRAGRYLAAHGAAVPWERLAGPGPCGRRLADTSHFHVDLDRRYVPGLCAGLVLPLEAVPGTVDLDRYPLLAALLDGGPVALARVAIASGFAPRPAYAGPCDLCTHARLHLHGRGDFPELGPDGFYDSRSVDG